MFSPDLNKVSQCHYRIVIDQNCFFFQIDERLQRHYESASFHCELFYFNLPVHYFTAVKRREIAHFLYFFIDRRIKDQQIFFFQSISRRDYADLYMSIIASVFVTQVMFSYCYLGAQLTAKSAEINVTIYSTEWYNYPCEIQMFMILIMKRAQKPFVITGYSLVYCNLESFKNVSEP